jgi:hypothetical protein
MITIRRADDRGRAKFDWLDSRHSFSFGHYYDPQHMGFRALRVINEDRVSPGGGFAPHGHKDMEIVSYVLSGALEHKDSIGTGSVIRPGDVQRMSAGTGITHSEYNASKSEPVHFLQIWIMPAKQGIKPGYEQRAFPTDSRRGSLRLLGASDGRDGAITLHQDAEIYGAILDDGAGVTHALRPGRGAWVQVARGDATVNGHELHAGDGAAIEDEREITLSAVKSAEVLLFDLA